jgi:hypothetical protein
MSLAAHYGHSLEPEGQHELSDSVKLTFVSFLKMRCGNGFHDALLSISGVDRDSAVAETFFNALKSEFRRRFSLSGHCGAVAGLASPTKAWQVASITRRRISSRYA